MLLRCQVGVEGSIQDQYMSGHYIYLTTPLTLPHVIGLVGTHQWNIG
jgi:hypothetical protein